MIDAACVLPSNVNSLFPDVHVWLPLWHAFKYVSCVLCVADTIHPYIIGWTHIFVLIV